MTDKKNLIFRHDKNKKSFLDEGYPYYPESFYCFEGQEFNEGRERIMNIIEIINELAGNNDISIRMFNALTEYYLTSANNVELTAFEATAGILYNLITTNNLPRYIRSKKHLQKMLDGKFYLRKEDAGFAEFAEQTNAQYGGIIYIIKPVKQFCIFTDILELIYIGVTWKTIFERFIEHTEDAVDSYIKDSGWSSRLIEHLIQTAMEDFLKHEYSYVSGISPLKHFIETEILEKEDWQKKLVIENIAKELYSTYFYMEVIEAHRNYETAWYREIWYIKNYPRHINGKFVRGTLFPNGLNMVISPEKPGHISLPIYDTIFLVSLGFIGPEINQMIQKYYPININFRSIYTNLNKFWKNWDNILKQFFKPVLQALLKNENYQWKDIAKAIRRAPSYRIKKNFKEWFFGLNITQLRYIMKREDFNWNNLEEIAIQLKTDLANQSTVKRTPIDVWIEWFIKDIGMEEIAKILGYKNVESFRSAWIKQGRVSIFQKKFGSSYSLAVKKYRKKRTIELLTDEEFLDNLLESKLYWIYVNEFGFMRWENLAVNKPSQGLRNCKHFFNTLFKKEGLTTNDLENLTAFNYMDQKIYDAVIRISNS